MSKKKIPVLKTKKDFYEFFEAIPDQKWNKGNFKRGSTYCALGHLGCRNKEPSQITPALREWEETENGLNFLALGGTGDELMEANDGPDKPKKSVLKYIKTLKSKIKSKKSK